MNFRTYLQSCINSIGATPPTGPIDLEWVTDVIGSVAVKVLNLDSTTNEGDV